MYLVGLALLLGRGDFGTSAPSGELLFPAATKLPLTPEKLKDYAANGYPDIVGIATHGVFNSECESGLDTVAIELTNGDVFCVG